jgi:hypothetical protein
MTAGEAEFHAEGVGLLASAGEATGPPVRLLGAFELRYQRRGQKNTMHLCMVAEHADHLLRSPRARSVGGDDTGSRRNLADRLLSLATIEFQDPAMTWLRGTRGESRSQ